MTGIVEQAQRGSPEHESGTRERLLRFFEAESRDRCERIIAVLVPEAAPQQALLAECVADAKAIRGGAAMADLTTIAAIAGHMERILKGLHGHRFAWTAALSTTLRTAANQLLDLIDAVSDWRDEHERMARSCITELARYDVTPRRADSEIVIPIARLFYSDSGPHILFMPATPQTEFEQQLRALAARNAPGGELETPPRPRDQRRRTPTAPRGHELHTLLGESVTRIKATFGGSAEELVPIERLQYSGVAALHRARALARTIRARGAENSRDLIPELIDLLDLAASA